jgi:hypothetical protein
MLFTPLWIFLISATLFKFRISIWSSFIIFHWYSLFGEILAL